MRTGFCRFASSLMLRSTLGLILLLVSSTPADSAQLTITGVMRALEEVTVRSEFSGIVQRIAVKEGEQVREGQLLVQLRNERQKITLEVAQARLAKADASVEETKVVLDNAEKELN